MTAARAAPFLLSAGLGSGEALSDPDRTATLIELAEAARIDLLLLGEPAAASRTPSFDPLVVASWLAPRAGGVGLVPLVPTLASEPFHVARALSALDFLSAGRSGWLPTSLAFDAARLGAAGAVAAPLQVPKALDFIAATRSLWDGWDADALVMDATSGVYLHPDKVRAGNYRGEFFQVQGPLNAARPPQGEPLLVQSDTDPLWEHAGADVLVTDLEAPKRAALSGARLPRRVVRMSPRAGRSECDELEHAFHAGAIDGIHLVIGDPLTDFPAFSAQLLPQLRNRNLFSGADRRGSLRSRLGLPVPTPRPVASSGQVP